MQILPRVPLVAFAPPLSYQPRFSPKRSLEWPPAFFGGWWGELWGREVGKGGVGWWGRGGVGGREVGKGGVR